MSETNTMHRELHSFLPACPVWLEWEEQNEGWYIGVRNVGWCTVSEMCLEVEKQPIKISLSLSAGEFASVKIGDFTHIPDTYILLSVTTTDGVVWNNTEKSRGITVDAPILPETDQPNYDEFVKAWQQTQPLFQPEIKEKYWRCGCGQVNDKGRTFCGKCAKERDWVFDHLDGPTTLQTLLREQQEREKQQRLEQQQSENQRQKRNRILKWSALCTGAVAVIAAIVLVINLLLVPARRYAQAQGYLGIDRYYEAYERLSSVSDYKDAEALRLYITRKLCAETSLSAGYRHVIKNNANGEVSGTGNVLDGALSVEKWRAIRAVSAGKDHSLGLHYDGTVMAVGKRDTGALQTGNWVDVIRIGAGDGFSVGLKKDGTVVATGNNDYKQCHLSHWKDIKEIAVGQDFVLGLRSDGTVVAQGNNKDGQCNVSEWKDIIYIAAGNSHALGVRADGTVVAVGKNDSKACEVSTWKDIVAVTAGDGFTVGIHSDGTLVATGENRRSQIAFEEDLTAIGVVSGWDYSIVITPDGKTLFYGTDEDEEGAIGHWIMDK